MQTPPRSPAYCGQDLASFVHIYLQSSFVRDNARMTDKQLLDERAAADLLGIEPRTLRLWRKQRGLPHYQITRKVVRFKEADLMTWLESHRVAQIGGAR